MGKAIPPERVKYRCQGCKHDLTALINAVPIDDVSYVFDCPVCGRATRVRRTTGAPRAASKEQIDYRLTVETTVAEDGTVSHSFAGGATDPEGNVVAAEDRIP